MDLNLRHLNRQIYNTYPEVKESNTAFHERDSAKAKVFNTYGIRTNSINTLFSTLLLQRGVSTNR